MISLLYLFNLVVNCLNNRGLNHGQQKVSTGAIWFEYRQHTAKNEYPTIVFESGALSYSNYWNPVIDSIAKYANTIRYDRAGLGRSLPSRDSVRSVVQITRELNELLDSLKIGSKIILLCHSVGGYYGRAFSALHSERVRALVLIESPCAEWEDLLQSGLSEMQNKERDSILKLNRSELSYMERQEYKAADINRKILEKIPKMIMPVYIIQGIGHNWVEGYNRTLLNAIWQDCQRSLLSISEESSLIKVPNAGHHIFGEFDLPNFIYEQLLNKTK